MVQGRRFSQVSGLRSSPELASIPRYHLASISLQQMFEIYTITQCRCSKKK
ncbi:unnamed protein product [Lupinus luteus]|uniref:Uncharacterized protein n=1 Tax=Lupinus luteus TaxID=3873 RepID=A0AAV1XID3_LUPLU